jgi:hypothetical protein
LSAVQIEKREGCFGRSAEAYASMSRYSRTKDTAGPQLSDEQEKTLARFLFDNKDVFAWLANDLCGVNRDVIERSLNVDPSFRPRKQRLRKMSEDKAEGARNEVKRLLSAGVIREVKYQE